ncbi:MAG: outer membrane protein assembly factor BamE [Gammaproteobacteria bacterium]|nr:outer membrane protein assembly factor BamE [Gammaproteobacteria bacterium]MBU2057745.1 outer membrane protein assembly factor BamE [Gammaproteobacteria bacterium]MBU2174715.1 outer membrane protein assembly factor BamE [Gammaproteobacteria bacterium]MBU2248972.1 outer membrane protein assembly factor BamE [Gammaproteobacteria bacterium]MBU2345176.1 outer membrane protein assembly factor BamE [Gammaproteobacteria bacterium]
MKKIVVLLAVLTLLGACSKLTQDNYDQVKAGMTYDEVTSILGTATHCDEAVGTKSCLWGDDAKNIKITFLAGRATVFSNQGIQ